LPLDNAHSHLKTAAHPDNLLYIIAPMSGLPRGLLLSGCQN